MYYCHQCPSVGCLVGHNNFVQRAYRSTCKIHNQMDDEKNGQPSFIPGAITAGCYCYINSSNSFSLGKNGLHNMYS